MSKVIVPPQIHDLDGLLDVLIHPEKYAQYMADMKAMRDSIQDLLGVLDTKEKADDALDRANRKHMDAMEALAVAQDEADKIKSDVAQAQAQHQAQVAAFAKEKAQILKDLDQDRDTIATAQQNLDKAQADLLQREQALALKDAQLQSKAQALTEKEARLNKLKAALGEAGI